MGHFPPCHMTALQPYYWYFAKQSTCNETPQAWHLYIDVPPRQHTHVPRLARIGRCFACTSIVRAGKMYRMRRHCQLCMVSPGAQSFNALHNVKASVDAMRSNMPFKAFHQFGNRRSS